MIAPDPALRLCVFLLSIQVLTGCRFDGHGSHDHSSADGSPHDHGHGSEAATGASFKAGEGVSLKEETKQLLAVQTVDVTSQQITNQIRFTLQVFGEKHRHGLNVMDHQGCDVHGSALLSFQAAKLVQVGQMVEVFAATNQARQGWVLSVHPPLALGEPEIIVGISNATSIFKQGEFIPARILIPREGSVSAVPRSAVLRTSEGTFVYVANGGAYLRTAVKTGAETDSLVEITDGLLEGDQVVATSVEALWLIELRATKGGGHSH